jgi:hypothetical protein
MCLLWYAIHIPFPYHMLTIMTDAHQAGCCPAHAYDLNLSRAPPGVYDHGTTVPTGGCPPSGYG